ncbi:MAG: ATP-binding protein [Candidatus Symbiobacter sp.]|nr:ATP-binding protein [Candidatus Symbiobacter sp.]
MTVAQSPPRERLDLGAESPGKNSPGENSPGKNSPGATRCYIAAPTPPMPNQAIERYAKLSETPEPEFDRLTDLAAEIFAAPIAAISMIDQERQWFKARRGLSICEIPRDQSFCSYAILQNGVMVVPDAQADARFTGWPMVEGEGGIRFYAGAPLITPDGWRVGTLCLADTKPRPPLSLNEQKTFAALAAQVIDQLELRLARSQAEQALTEKNNFLAMLSHEIRTPVSGMVGLAQLLQESAMATQQRHYVNTILSSGRSLVRLLDDMLELSKFQAGHIPLIDCHFTIESVIDPLVTTFEQKARAKNLHLRRVLSGPPNLHLIGDAERIRQVINNLLNNAIKYTTSGDIIVTAAIFANIEPTIRLVCSIKDTGPGIPPERLERLGEDYYQVNDATSRKAGGVGLGLAISRRILHRLGGKLRITSQVGVGSEFSFSLVMPLWLDSSRDAEGNPYLGYENFDRESLLTPLPDPAAPRGDILCVDDDQAGLMVISEMLRRAGYRVVGALNASETLRFCRERQFDAILLDMNLPDMDGVTIARILRRESGPNQSTPLIAVTASAFASDREACLAAGMDEHISKPLNFKILLERLHHMTQKFTSPTQNQPNLPSTPGPNAIDLSGLHQLRGMMGEPKFAEILRHFARSISDLGDAAQAGNKTIFFQTAHLLVGTAGSLGLDELCNAARMVNNAHHQGGSTTIEQDLALIYAAKAALTAVQNEFYDIALGG